MNTFETELLKSAAVEVSHSPSDDRQFTIRPARVTPLRGVLRTAHSLIGSFNLPDTTNHYVLYEIGQVMPFTIGMESSLLSWERMDNLALYNEMLVHLHIQQRHLPIASAYIMRTSRKNIIIAVDARVNRDLLNSGEYLYLHIYSNDWIATESQGSTENIWELSATLGVLEDASPVLTAFHSAGTGNHYLFHNGYYVNDRTAGELAIGDNLAYLYDATGRGYVDFELSELKHYQSQRDSMEKLLILLPLTALMDPMTSEPGDELEIYICDHVADVGVYPRVQGVYYSRLQGSDIRMLTHRDFALDALRIELLIEEHRAAIPFTTPFIRVFLRHHTNGVHDAKDGSYLHDLMRAGGIHRESLMVGTAGTYIGWHPSQLESAPALLFQQARSEDMTLASLKGVYSLEEINHRLHTGINQGDTYILPYAMNLGGYLLLFDAAGKLMGKLEVPAGSGYQMQTLPAGTVSVECLPGNFTSTGVGMDRDTDFLSVADWWNEQYYYRRMGDDAWIPAVEGVDYHINRETLSLRWDDTHNLHERMLRTVKDAIHRSLTIEPEMLHIPINIYTDTGPFTLLELARTDVYINGLKCVRGVDYIVNYPSIEISNKQYYLTDNDADISVEIFHYGLPQDTPILDSWGFIKHGLLRDTNPDIFFQHRDKQLTIDGTLSQDNRLGLYELPDTTSSADYREGALYAATAWPLFLGVVARERLAASDVTLANQASGAVGKLLAGVENTAPVFIPYGHAIFSPFIKRTIVRIRTGVIDVSALGTSTTAVALAMTPYIHELDNDVLSSHMDIYMVDVHPTPNIVQVDITEDELLFLREVSRLYCNDRLVFNTYTNVQEPH